VGAYTEARQHDVRPARQVPLRPGSIVVVDRGYTDFALFGRWCHEGIFWVTRMKEGTAYTVEESRNLPKATAFWQTRSFCSPAPPPRPSAPTGCGASWSGMPTNSARSRC
jgi:hypothetical protein